MSPKWGGCYRFDLSNYALVLSTYQPFCLEWCRCIKVPVPRWSRLFFWGSFPWQFFVPFLLMVQWPELKSCWWPPRIGEQKNSRLEPPGKPKLDAFVYRCLFPFPRGGPFFYTFFFVIFRVRVGYFFAIPKTKFTTGCSSIHQSQPTNQPTNPLNIQLGGGWLHSNIFYIHSDFLGFHDPIWHLAHIFFQLGWCFFSPPPKSTSATSATCWFNMNPSRLQLSQLPGNRWLNKKSVVASSWVIPWFFLIWYYQPVVRGTRGAKNVGMVIQRSQQMCGNLQKMKEYITNLMPRGWSNDMVNTSILEDKSMIKLANISQFSYHHGNHWCFKAFIFTKDRRERWAEHVLYSNPMTILWQSPLDCQSLFFFFTSAHLKLKSRPLFCAAKKATTGKTPRLDWLRFLLHTLGCTD